MRPASLLLVASLAACASGEKTTTEDTAAVAATAGGETDRDATVGGNGVPAGYVGRVDRENANLADASYSASGDAWEVRTGPAHIVYAPRDSASGAYTATATIDQLAAPAHPEAFGLFVGGQNLDQPSQKYTYFVVRGTGEYLLKVRDGANARDIQKWTASPAVPKQDAEGKASYRLAARVGADSVRFLVNDQPVVAVPASAVDANGVAGLRINHNLHLRVRPLTVQRGS